MLEVDDEFIDRVENRLGMGHGAWDDLDPKEIARAVLAEAGIRWSEHVVLVDELRNSHNRFKHALELIANDPFDSSDEPHTVTARKALNP